MKRVVAAILMLAVTCGGCGLPISREAPQKKEFVLDVSRPEGEKAKTAIGMLRTSEFRVPQQYEGRGFKYRMDDLTFQSDFYNEFFVLPGQMIAEEAGQWLADSGMFIVNNGADAKNQRSFILDGTIQELYGDFRPAVPNGVMEIEFVLLEDVRGRREAFFRNSYRQEVPASGRSAKELAKAWNEALFSILQGFEDDLQKKAPDLAR